MKEHRKRPRFECKGTAEMHFFWNGSSCPALIEDVSLTGCRLVMLEEAEIELQRIFELTFTVNELPFRVRAKATSIRCAGHIGVEFVEVRPRLSRYLLDLIEELAAGEWKPNLRSGTHNASPARDRLKLVYRRMDEEAVEKNDQS
jgi:PilZ domain